MFANVRYVGEVYGLKRRIMRYRPKRKNYPSGRYGDFDYQERLERYCTYLENKISKLHQPIVISSVCDCEPHTFYEWEKDENKCRQCGKPIYKQSDL